MIRALVVLVALIAGWVGALWFLIAPDFNHWPLREMAALHALPPVGLWTAWQFWRRWRIGKAAALAADREAALSKENEAQIAAARCAHAEEIARRQFGCDCRAVALAQVVVPDGLENSPVPEGDGVYWSQIQPDSPDEDLAVSAADFLGAGVDEALRGVYAYCPAAATFPIYIVPPPDTVGEQAVAAVRQIQRKLFIELDIDLETPTEYGRVLFLRSRDGAGNNVIELFENNPELPGAVVLAFDSPWLRAALQGDEEERPERPRNGSPSQGVFAVFVTNPRLPEMLSELPVQQGGFDVMTPYWEKGAAVAARSAFLAGLSQSLRESLIAMPALARIHRTVSSTFAGKAERPMEFARALGGMIEQAQIDAGLVDVPFIAAVDNIEEERESAAPACGWLVHNAGGVDVCGKRLAGISVAMAKRGYDLDPIESATNVVIQIGDLGEARSVAMLAIAAARAADTSEPVLCAEFSGRDDVSLYFACPMN